MQMLEYLNLVSTGGVLTTGLDLFLLNILLFFAQLYNLWL
jgi:hypothetical protein